MVSPDEEARVALPAPVSGEEARAFLQERLAFLGQAYAVMAVGFYLAGHVVTALTASYRLLAILTDPASLIVTGTAASAAAVWVACRRGRLKDATLLVVDGAFVLVVTLLNSLMVFARFPGEVPGLSYARALLLVTFGLVFRAIVVPSTARRTLLLGLAAVSFPVVTTTVWMARMGSGVPALVQAIWTALWCLGAVVIATLASRSIFGLRQQVREAWQLGQYTLLEKIGEGGMGTVYRASHAMLRRPTAVKLLPPGQAGAERLQRFEREVQLTSRLTHPNTISIFDYGRTPDGVFYYAMEYLEGLNLEDLLRQDGAQPAGRVVHVLRQVAGSLAEAHEVGLIHRDVKPANVILVAQRGGASDVAKVVDFGLVKDLDQATDLSREDRIAGTPLYLAPEAITAPGRVGARSDLYSLGCVGYYLLTGRPVFEGRNVVEVCGHHLHTRPVPPGERLGQPVPEGLQALLLACLEKEPSRRPSFAGEFLETLDALRDIPPWTNEQARGWWTTRGALLTARVRAAARGGKSPARAPAQDSGVGTLSFVRRVDVRRGA
jgi:eukaryotic-like serine/threonine-protein kinase